MNRDQHLEWCKQRAKKLLDIQEPRRALASIMSDLKKHPETEDHPAARLAIDLWMNGNPDSLDAVGEVVDLLN